jgi:phage shock protein A
VFPDLDAAHERQLETLARVRRAVATVATSRKRLDRQVGQLEREVGELDGQIRAGMDAGQVGIANERQVSRGDTERRLAGLRRQHAAMQAEEERAFAASRCLQARLNAFLAAKEAVEAAYTAADEAARAAWAEVTGNAGADAEGAGSAAGQQNWAGNV